MVRRLDPDTCRLRKGPLVSLLGLYGAAPVSRLRAKVAADSYGDPTEDWTAPDRLRLKGASVRAVASREDGGLVRDERLVLVPGFADLTAADRVEADGEVWGGVDGGPLVRRGLASGTTTTATLRRVERL